MGGRQANPLHEAPHPAVPACEQRLPPVGQQSWEAVTAAPTSRHASSTSAAALPPIMAVWMPSPAGHGELDCKYNCEGVMACRARTGAHQPTPATQANPSGSSHAVGPMIRAAGSLPTLLQALLAPANCVCKTPAEAVRTGEGVDEAGSVAHNDQVVVVGGGDACSGAFAPLGLVGVAGSARCTDADELADATSHATAGAPSCHASRTSPNASTPTLCALRSPWPPTRSEPARMRSHLGLGPMAREMKGSCLIAFSCSRFRSSACEGQQGAGVGEQAERMRWEQVQCSSVLSCRPACQRDLQARFSPTLDRRGCAQAQPVPCTAAATRRAQWAATSGSILAQQPPRRTVQLPHWPDCAFLPQGMR